MLIDKRTLLKNALLLSSTNFLAELAWAEQVHFNHNKIEVYASALTHIDGKHYIALFDENGTILWKKELTDRAHAPIFHPSLAIVGVVARRPGFYLNLYDMNSAAKIVEIAPTKHHHFYGHGLFTTTGEWLVTPENHYPSGQGKIFIRDWRNNTVTSQFPSYGIGPHEIHFLNKDVLVVANGGLQTHPNNDRRIVNIDSMKPNLAFISISTGKLLKKLELPVEWQQLSIRHMDINQFGEIVVGFQYQGKASDDMPLVGHASFEDTKINILDMPPQIKQRFRQYCGSVTFDKSGKLLAISSPRGGIVAYWDMETRRYFEHHNYGDVCGIAPTSEKNCFLLTTGQGKRVIVNPINDQKITLAAMNQYQWDNHIHRLST